MPRDQQISSGSLTFTVESRILRELGERLVKEPEVALNELIKNAYDADATSCEVSVSDDSIVVIDTGSGMTLDAFKSGWMRIGTSSKATVSRTSRFGRHITGEKGIGRFAVRFLGDKLVLQSTAYDAHERGKTTLTASFDWPLFDKHHDLGKVDVPYTLVRATDEADLGTTLNMSLLTEAAHEIDFRSVRTSSLAVLSPYASLMTSPVLGEGGEEDDKGFQLILADSSDNEDLNIDVAEEILNNYVLRGRLTLRDRKLRLDVFARGKAKPHFSVKTDVENLTGDLNIDLRFFPQRAGTFRGLSLDGRAAKTWVKRHSGIAVFDRTFRVYPYGTTGDDWLSLDADSARNERSPKSSLAKTFFPMDDATRRSTEVNYMLRLPHSEQVIGVVEVAGKRSTDSPGAKGLIASADREGFVRNSAFLQLEDLTRGVAEAIAYVDRDLQLAEERLQAQQRLEGLRRETQETVKAIEDAPNISASLKRSLIASFLQTQKDAEQLAKHAKEREATLEVMSLMGVVAGFMTHEFGAALYDLERAKDRLRKLSQSHPELKEDADQIDERLRRLQEFVSYSQGYVRGASQTPDRAYPVQPRVQQVVRVFGKYADERDIAIKIEIDKKLMAPPVPASLYNGLALNLYTNALKAVTAASRPKTKEIVFRAWNEKGQHLLEVSDTGVGIPSALRERIFDPLFTTTADNRDPLGSGLGLGLALVRRCAEAFGGSADIVDPPPGYSTCFQIRLPLSEG